MKLTLHRSFPILGLALAAVLFVVGATILPKEAVAVSNDCTAKEFDFKEVEAACKSGGRKAVKKLMKKVVKESRKANDEKTCLDCHKDLKSYARTKNAVEDLKKYLK